MAKLPFPLWHFRRAVELQLATMILMPLPFPDAPIPYTLNFYFLLIGLNSADEDRTTAMISLRQTGGSHPQCGTGLESAH
jgi:hypothetical protein